MKPEYGHFCKNRHKSKDFPPLPIPKQPFGQSIDATTRDSLDRAGRTHDPPLIADNYGVYLTFRYQRKEDPVLADSDKNTELLFS
jgi:hypothetical protein